MYKLKPTTPQIFLEKKLKARYLAQLHHVSCFQKGVLHKQSTAPTHKNLASVNINTTFLQTNPVVVLLLVLSRVGVSLFLRRSH